MSKLIELANNYLNDSAQGELQALTSHLDFLGEQLRSQEQMLNELVEEKPEAESACSVDLDGYFSTLNRFESSLDALSSAFESKNKDELLSLAQTSARIEYELNVAWDRVQTAIRNVGQISRLQPINELFALAQDVADGLVPASFLGAAARREERKVELLLHSASEPLLSAFKELKQTLKNLADHLDQMDVLSEELPELDPLLEPLLRSADAVVGAQSREALERHAEGPTQIPNLNLLLYFLDLYWEGQVTQEEILSSLETVFQIMSRLEEGSADMLATLSGTIEEECARLNEVVQDMEVSLMDLEDMLLDPNTEENELSALKTQLVDLAEELTELQTSLQKLSEMEGKIPCVACSAYNPSERRHCVKCGAILPANAMEKVTQLEFVAGQKGIEDAKTQKKTDSGENFRRLFQALDRALAGQDTFRLIQREIQKLSKITTELMNADPGQASSSEERELFQAHSPQLRQFRETLEETHKATSAGDLQQLSACREELWKQVESLQDFKEELENVAEHGTSR